MKIAVRMEILLRFLYDSESFAFGIDQKIVVVQASNLSAIGRITHFVDCIVN